MRRLVGLFWLAGCGGDVVEANESTADTSDVTGEPIVCATDETRPCYSGPSGSDAILPCHAGTQLCEGEAWGACVGEVVPATSDCNAPGDESCGTAARCPGEAVWSAAFPGEAVIASALAVDPGGDIYVVGAFEAALQLDPPLTAKTPRDTFLARLRPTGERVWARRFGAGSAQSFHFEIPDASDEASLYLDGDGDLVLTVRCGYVIDFGTGDLVGEPGDPAVARIAPDGTTRWARRFAGLQTPLFAAPGPAGAVWLAGALDGVVDLGDGPVAHPGWADVLVIALSADGDLLRSAYFGDLGHQAARAIAVAPDGDVVVAGHFTGTLDFGTGPLYSGGGQDIFVARLAPDLGPRWATHFPALGAQDVVGVVADARGVTFAGNYHHGFDLGGGRLEELVVPDSSGFNPTGFELATQGFLAALDPAGAHRWSLRLGVAAPLSVGALRPGPGDGYILSGARADVGAVFDGLQLGADAGAWLAMIGPNGEQRWRWRLGESDGARMTGAPVPALALDRIVIAIGGSGVHALGGEPLGIAGEDSLFFAAFAP